MKAKARNRTRTTNKPRGARRAPTSMGGSVGDQVLEGLLEEILSGRYGPGARLATERDLATSYGVSRVSVRSALQRLSEWNVLAVRQGSGMLVRSRREWTLDVLPAYMRFEMLRGDPRTSLGALRDLLAMRRALVAGSLASAAGRPLDPACLEAARAAVRKGWERRTDFAEYIACELEMIRSLLEAAGMVAAVWVLNKLAGVYVDLAVSFPVAPPTPKDHLSSKLALIDALEAGDAALAQRIIGKHLEAHDRQLLALAEGR